MGSDKWKKTKQALGCLQISQTLKDDYKKTCAICLNRMNPGQDNAVFTAECTHSFHFNCITSNVKYGNRVCPVCMVNWQEIPFQRQTPGLPEKLTGNLVSWNRNDPWMAALQQQPLPQPSDHHLQPPEPGFFNDDDDPIEEQSTIREQASNHISNQTIEISTWPEVFAIPKSASYDDFAILIHLKALAAEAQNSRRPVDLVTVLDVSNSMAGTKLALLKQAMGFVIKNLGPQDRLSVIVFSSTARRLFPLRLMTDTGRYQALQSVNSLSTNGGTNITEGLKKGAKVLLDRELKNPASTILLLSDGHDTGTMTGTDYMSFPPSFFPVHTFGFGEDHDDVSMYSISEASGGTFTFIEDEDVIQDAVTQCMGGLLSMTAHRLMVFGECLHPSLELTRIEAEPHLAGMTDDLRNSFVNFQDLYAGEDRFFLAHIKKIPEASTDEMPLLGIECTYRDPLTSDQITLGELEVNIDRPESTTGPLVVSIEVDKQLNRVRAAEAMSWAKFLAGRGDLAGAIFVLERCCEMLSESRSAGDRLTVGLGNELREMQERMYSRQVYEASERAYVLSGQTTESWKSATSSTTNLPRVCQTRMMGGMITRSQIMVLGNVSSTRVPPPVSLFQPPLPR